MMPVRPWRVRRLAALTALALALLAPASRASAGDLCVQLKWLHQAQFAGFYAAESAGLYSRAGLHVRFVEGGPGTDWAERLADPSCPMGVTSPEEILSAVARGVPVRAVAAIDQVSPIVWFALESSGIWEPRQFRGKRVAVVPTGRLHLRGMLSRVGVGVREFTAAPFSLDMSPLYAGEVDVWSGYATNLVTRAREEGRAVTVIHPMDYGVQVYDDVIYARTDLIESDPKLVEAFLRATFDGWMYAIRSPDEAVRHTMRFVGGASRDAAHQLALLRETIPYVHTGEVPVGWMDASVWRGIAALALDVGLVERPVGADEVMDASFIRRIYPEAGGRVAP
jgi:ABC-type nitrate/sulfonate/bicarbonate transport system substrate-binding protein